MHLITVSGQVMSNLTVQEVGKGKNKSKLGTFQLEMPAPGERNEAYLFDVTVPESLFQSVENYINLEVDGPLNSDEDQIFVEVSGRLNIKTVEQDGRKVKEYSIRLERISEASVHSRTNIVIVDGNVGQDPEARYFESGTNNVKFSIAANDGKDGATHWFPIVFWGKSAETVATYVKKGQQLFITGFFAPYSYKGSTGDMIDAVEIRGNSFTFGKPPKNDENGGEKSQQKAQPQSVGADEEIPGDWG